MPADAGPPHELFDSVGAAVEAILDRDKPRVLGIGEAHQLKHTAHLRSSLSRFTTDVVPVLAKGKASNLVLETWAEKPSCGKAQKQVDQQVRVDTQRPEETQSELMSLLKALDAKGIGRHGMAMSCDEYKALLDQSEKVDYPKLLSLITKKLGTLALEVNSKAPNETVIVVYGGALHNDLYPNEGVEGWSYAAGVDAATQNKYVELDLYVPEFIADDKVLANEPWFALASAQALDDKVMLIARGPRSWVILAKRGVKQPKSP